MAAFLFFIFGLLVGSFLNVLIDRLSNEQSIVYPPSHCDHCKKPLAWYDLIPVVSFLMLSGRCRYCKKSIGWRYPVVELLTGTLFVGVFLFKGGWESWGSLMYYLFIISSFIVVFFADLKYGIIPDKIIFPAIAVSVLYFFILHPSSSILHLFSGVGAFLFFFAIFLITRGRGMGFGDVKLSFLLGLFLGFPTIVIGLYIAFLTGAFFSIILMILRRKKLKETIAFGPFLIIGALFAFFFQDVFSLWILPMFTKEVLL